MSENFVPNVLGPVSGNVGGNLGGPAGAPPASAGPSASLRASRTRLFAALPRLSSTAMALRNRAYRSAPSLLSDERILIWQDSGPVVTIGELACRIGDWQLALAADNLAHIEPRLEGFEAYVPTETCAALVEHALSPVLSLLERLAGVPVQCDEFRRGPALHTPGDEVRIGFVVLENNLQPALRGWVRTTPDAWHQLDFSRTLALPSRRIGAVPVRFSVLAGGCRLTLGELRSLKVGDALRSVPRLYRDAHPFPVSLLAGAAGGLLIPASVSGEEMTLEPAMTDNHDPLAPFRSGLTQAASNPDGVATEDLLADVECELSFELGSLRMTVADIARLRAGQSLRLGVRLQEQPVRVLVNGRLLARGELAAVGDELVVVLTDTSRLPQI